MNKLFLLVFPPLFLMACLSGSGEDELQSCSQTSCDVGFHCNDGNGQCEQDCVPETCAEFYEYCNPDTGLCEFDCTLSGCTEGFVCDETSRQCMESCLVVGCESGFYCDTDTQLCHEECYEGSCGDTGVCNLETHVCEPIILFADPNFEQCVRDRIGLPDGSIVSRDLADVWWLECIDRGITSIEGIQFMTALSNLTLWENDITDISQLSGLTQMTMLQLGSNQISDISPLSGLTGLTRLGLYGNAIEDISALSGLTLLEWLNLDDNHISDLAPLAGLTNLTWLTIEDNDFTNGTVLNDLARNGCEVYAGLNRSGKEGEEDGPYAVGPLPLLSEDIRIRPILNFTVDESGEVLFDYVIDRQSHEIYKEYSGQIVLEDDEFFYRLADLTIPIGRIDGQSIELCSGEFGDVCELSFGTKSDPYGIDPMFRHPDEVASSVFSVTLNILPDSMVLLSDDLAGYGEIYNELDPFVLASPNQYDAGSCLFMANTGTMEILLNQHTLLDNIEYEGDTDLSERFLMSVDVPSLVTPYFVTDTPFVYNHIGGSLLNRDYRFAAGYVRETSEGYLVEAEPDESGAYFSCQINWINDLPDNWQDLLVPTPEVDRTVISLDPNLNSNSIWNVGLFDDDVVERIKYELRTKNAPVIIVYNHYLFWHADIIVGYDDTRAVTPCPMVEDSLEYYEEEGATGYVSRIENHREDIGGCLDHGLFYVRDSIYDGGSDELMYNYSTAYLFRDRYSKRVILRTYDWVRFLSNHAYTVHRR